MVDMLETHWWWRKNAGSGGLGIGVDGGNADEMAVVAMVEMVGAHGAEFLWRYGRHGWLYRRHNGGTGGAGGQAGVAGEDGRIFPSEGEDGSAVGIGIQETAGTYVKDLHPVPKLNLASSSEVQYVEWNHNPPNIQKN